MSRERLELLANFLETHEFKPGKFHLAIWMGSYEMCSHEVHHEDDPIVPLLQQRAGEVKVAGPTFINGLPVDCKTVGCAVGWGIVGIPSFREQGFNFDTDRLAHVSKAASLIYIDPDTGEKYHQFDAVAKFFDISMALADWLFLQSSYEDIADRSNPVAVAKRIRAALAQPE